MNQTLTAGAATRSLAMLYAEELFDSRADSWRTVADDPRNYFFQRSTALVSLIGRHLRPCRALDIGCGTGMLSRRLYDRGFDVCGCDLSERMIEQAVASHGGAMDDPDRRFQTSIDGVIPFGDRKFDVITAIGVLPYVEQRARFIQQLASRLTPDGALVLSSNNRLCPYTAYAIARELCGWPNWNRLRCVWNLARTGVWSGGYVDYGRSENVYSARALDRLVASEGFALIDSVDLVHLPPLDNHPHRRGLPAAIARRLAWNHIGLYRRAAASV